MELKLQESEEILFEAKPDAKIFLMWIFTKVIPMTFLASVYSLIFLMLFFVSSTITSYCALKNISPLYYLWRYIFILFPLWFIFFLFYYYKLKDTFHYYITNYRCVFEGGIFVKRRRNVPYHKITDVEVNQNIIERLLGIYSLKIFTPGTGSVGAPGLEKAEICFYGLQDAEKPANIIQGIIKKLKATGE